MENGTRAERDRKWTHRITKHGIAWNIYDLLHSTQMLVSLDHPLVPMSIILFLFSLTILKRRDKSRIYQTCFCGGISVIARVIRCGDVLSTYDSK